MSAERLQGALARAGLAAEVEGRDRLALIRAADIASTRAIAARRSEVMAMAIAHGFSHIALEVGTAPPPRPASDRHAALPGD